MISSKAWCPEVFASAQQPRRLTRPGSSLPNHRLLHGRLAIERFQRIQIHPFNVAADAALRETQRHPGLKPFDHLRRNLRMLQQEIVQSIRKRVHQCFQPRGASRILLL